MQKLKQEDPLNFNSFVEQQISIKNLIQIQRIRLQHTLQRINKYAIQQFNHRKNILLQSCQKFKEADKINQDLVYEYCLPFSDRIKHLRQKLNNSVQYKQFLMNVQFQLTKKCELSKEENNQAKKNFDLICNYAKRKQSDIKGKLLYDINVCKYLVKKTFKKTALEVYQILSAYPIQNYIQEKTIIKIACIGGGPGSDLTGVINLLLELNFCSFQCIIFDYNNKNWSEAAIQLQKILINEAKKLNKIIQIKIFWKFFDMQQQTSQQLKMISNFDIITCCWALNQQSFKNIMWQKIISQNPRGLFLFIDGDRYPIQNLLGIDQNRLHQYSHLQNPRHLILYPQ